MPSTCGRRSSARWEVRTKLRGREARVVFFFEEAEMILMHGFVRKERRTPLAELQLARDRKRQWEGTSHDK